jgi:hypothetical protein
MAEQSTYKDSLKKLRRTILSFGRFRKKWVLLNGVALFVLIGPGGLLAWFLLDWAIPLPAWPLFLLFVLVCGLSLWALFKWILKPQLHRVEVEHESLVIEDLHGELDNRLIGSLQLGEDVAQAEASDAERSYSTILVKALIERTRETVEGFKPRKLVDLRQPRKRLAGAIVVVAIAAACWIYAADAVRERFDRLRNAYAVVVETLFPVNFEVMPGDKPVVRGRPVTLSVKVLRSLRKDVELVRVDPETGESEATALLLADQAAEFTVEAAQHDFEYHFVYGHRSSDTHLIRVADLPEVKAINYEMTPPEYTGQPMRMMTGRIGALRSLPGTAVLVSFASSTALHPERCFVEWLNGEKQKIDISGRFGSFSFVIGQPDRVSIHLTGHFGDGFEMENPLTFQISPERDQAPAVQLLTKLTQSEIPVDVAGGLSLKWFALDDYGVEEVGYEYEVERVVKTDRVPTRRGSNERVYDPPRDRVKGGFGGLFGAMNPRLAPGDHAKLKVFARDNNSETGPGYAETAEIEFLVVMKGFDGFSDDNVGELGRMEKESQFELPESERIPREQDLMVPTIKLVNTEPKVEIKRIPVKPGASQEMEPVGRGTAAADAYMKLLSGTTFSEEDEE